MLGWCSCAQTPFQAIFGGGENIDPNITEDDDDVSTGSGYDPYKRQVRSAKEIDDHILKWIPLVHDRVKELWPDGVKDVNFREAMEGLLMNTDARDDPVTNPYENVCALWYGDVGVDDGAAVLSITGGGVKSLSYVVRLLAYIFADDSTFNLLQQNGGQGPLPMSCDNVRCVNIKHCIIPDDM